MRILSCSVPLLALVLVACADDGGDDPMTGTGGNAADDVADDVTDDVADDTDPGAGGDTGPGNGGRGGTSGAGGATGGSGGAPDGARRGAMSVQVLPSETCFVEPGFYDFPEIAAGHPVTSTEKTALFKDAALSPKNEKMSVFCMLRPLGGSEFLMRLTMSLDSTSQRAVQVSGMLSPSGNDNLGGIQEEPSQYEGPFRILDCSLKVHELDEQTRSIWGTMSCTSGRVTALDRNEACGVEIQFAFENCDPE